MLFFYHIILTVKYRKKIIEQYSSDIKDIIEQLSTQSNFDVEKIESDQDHLHILVSARPDISPSHLIKKIKQHTTYELWQKYPNQLQKEFWKKHIFWNRSYFVASIGSVSKEAIERYIANQSSSSVTLKGYQACCPPAKTQAPGEPNHDVFDRLEYLYFGIFDKEHHFVAFDGEKLIGDLAIQENPYNKDQIWLKHVSIDPNYRNQKIATKLYDMLFSYLEQSGHNLVRSSPSDLGKLYIPSIIQKMKQKYPNVNVINSRGE